MGQEVVDHHTCWLNHITPAPLTIRSGASVENTTQGSDQQNHLLGQTPSPEQQWAATYMTNHGTGNSSPWQDSSSLNH